MKKMKTVMIISIVAIALTLVLMIPVPVQAKVLESSAPCPSTIDTLANLSESMIFRLQLKNASFTFEFQGSNVTLSAESANIAAVSRRVVNENSTRVIINIDLKDAHIRSKMFSADFDTLKLNLEVNVLDKTVNFVVEAMTNMPLIQALVIALRNAHT